jgi:hypothetical protein
MPSARPRALGLVLAALVTGCGTLDVVQSGAVDPGEQPLPGGLPMTFDRLGGAFCGLKPVRLPLGRELHRFGLTVVDTARLAGFVPAHAAAHRVLVSSLERGSPLAWAGLRPFDALVTIDGQPVTTCEAVVASLGRKAPGETARLEVVGPDGATRRLEAAAVDEVHGASAFKVPLLFERQASASGSALALGPFDGFFWRRSVVQHWAVPPPPERDPAAAAPAPGSGEGPPFPPVPSPDAAPDLARASRSRFMEKTSGGTLWNLVTWDAERDLPGGAERSRIRLLWLIPIGDDLREDGPLPGEAGGRP